METKNIRRLILLGVIACVLSTFFFSCISERKRAEICASCPHSDSVKTIIKKERYDSLILVEIEGPIRWMPHPCANLCDSNGHLKNIDIKETKNGVTAELKSQGDSLELSAKVDSGKVQLKGLTRSITTDQISSKIYQVICQRAHRNKYDYVASIGFPICVILLLLIFIRWVKKLLTLGSK